MKEFRLPQEWLKAVACVSMLIDHIGIALVSNAGFRIAGRLAFPLFCFLLSEGINHTRNPRRYALRLLMLAVISEIPYDYMNFGRLDLLGQNVAFTLLIGILLAGYLKKDDASAWSKILAILLACVVAELLRTDYGGYGVALIAVFVLSEEYPRRNWLIAAVLLLMGFLMPGMVWTFYGIPIPVQLFGTAAVILIMLYSGEKAGYSRWSQWGFYLFYPVHMALLCLLSG